MRLEEVAKKIVSGQIMSRVEAKEEVGDEVVDVRKIIIPKAITEGRIVHSELVEIKFKKMVDEDRITKEGDIILKVSTPYDAAYVTDKDEGFVATSFCSIIRDVDSSKVDTRFLTAYLNTEYVREMLKSKVAGTSMPMIKISDIKKLIVPDVPLQKQNALGEAYALSCQKRDLLKEMLCNEQVLIDSIILNAVKGAE